MPRFLHVGLIGLLVFIVAACSSTPNQGPGSTPTPTSVTAQATPNATPTEAAGGATPTTALPSFALPHNATELEALLPDKAGTEPLTKTSSTGADFVGSASADPDIVAWLQSQGKALTDVSVASAYGATSGALILAFRINGVDSSATIAALQASMNKDLGSPIPWTPATVGGKSVVTSPASEGTVYVYGVSDLVFEVFAKDQATAAELLSKLP